MQLALTEFKTRASFGSPNKLYLFHQCVTPASKTFMSNKVATNDHFYWFWNENHTFNHNITNRLGLVQPRQLLHFCDAQSFIKKFNAGFICTHEMLRSIFCAAISLEWESYSAQRERKNSRRVKQSICQMTYRYKTQRPPGYG